MTLEGNFQVNHKSFFLYEQMLRMLAFPGHIEIHFGLAYTIWVVTLFCTGPIAVIESNEFMLLFLFCINKQFLSTVNCRCSKQRHSVRIHTASFIYDDSPAGVPAARRYYNLVFFLQHNNANKSPLVGFAHAYRHIWMVHAWPMPSFLVGHIFTRLFPFPCLLFWIFAGCTGWRTVGKRARYPITVRVGWAFQISRKEKSENLSTNACTWHRRGGKRALETVKSTYETQRAQRSNEQLWYRTTTMMTLGRCKICSYLGPYGRHKMIHFDFGLGCVRCFPSSQHLMFWTREESSSNITQNLIFFIHNRFQRAYHGLSNLFPICS